MRRAVTAIYRSHDVATLVRDELERLGIGRHQIRVLPDSGRASVSTGTADVGMPETVTTAPGRGAPGADFTGTTPRHADSAPAYTDADAPYARAIDEVGTLDLPEDDKRVYQQAIRNGDYVVSVEVDGNADLQAIEEVMRRPEGAYGIEEARHRPRRVITDDGDGKTVAAVFDSEAEAGGAVERLRSAAIPDRHISVHPTATERADLQAYGDQHKRFYESIKELPLPKDDRERIVETMTRGGYLVMVRDFEASQHDTIVAALEGRGASSTHL